MAEAQDNYVTDVPYTWGFFPTQSPAHLRYLALLRGAPARPLDKPFTYCELGCGNGLTSNVLAACFPQGAFTAVDLNPEHIANARATAARCGIANITYLERSFEALLDDALPKFDYVTLHGVYTWVSAPVRHSIVRVIERFLKPGGLVYLSYNAMPGWAPLLPIRQALMTVAERTDGNSLEKAARGLAYLKRLRDGKAAYFQANPIAAAFFDGLLDKDPSYIVHEYLNQSFEPLYASQVIADLAAAGLTYCGSADIANNYADMTVPEALRADLQDAADSGASETHKSLVLDERFRRDVYCRTARYLPRERRAARFADAVFGNIRGAAAVSREVTINGRKLRYEGELYDPLIAEAAPGRFTLAELCARPALRRFEREAVLQAIHNLVAGDQLQLFAEPASDASRTAGGGLQIVSPINQALLEARVLKGQSCELASPVLGNGLPVGFVTGLLLLGLDAAGPRGAIEQALSRLAASGKRWRRKGKALDTPAARRAAMTQELKDFRAKVAPVLLRAGIVAPTSGKPGRSG